MINLLDYRKMVYNNIGNEGVIENILNVLGIEYGVFVEFGAMDGIKQSNCRRLFKKGWDGIFIERLWRDYKYLKRNYKKYENIICLNEKINIRGEKFFDKVIAPYLKNKNIDYCVISINGIDLEVFETFKRYMPTIICIHGGMFLHPFYDRVDISISSKLIQQSLSVMIESFEKRGYKILCSCQNTFFIKKEYYHLFNVSGDVLTLYCDGLRVLRDKIPYGKKTLDKVGLKNSIIDYVLDNSNYDKYGWKFRAEWAVEEKDIIIKSINEIEKKERNELTYKNHG